MRILLSLLFLFAMFSAHAAPDARPELRAMSFDALYGGDKVDINRADASELSQRLKGIGEKKANAIVEYRNENGNFRTLRDLEKVKGIGPALLKKNRHLIIFTGK